MPLQPFAEFLQAFVECDARGVAENIPRERNVREAMANVADTVVLGNFRLDVFLVEHARDGLGDFLHGVVMAAPNVENLVCRFRHFERKAARLRDVLDVNEIALLPSIFARYALNWSDGTAWTTISIA